MAYTLAELNVLIAEARTAYHNLRTGKMARVVVDGGDGSRVEYAPANAQQLYAYIQDLQMQIDALTAPPTVPARGPAGFIF